MVAYYFISPIDAYDINMKIEKHAYETYVKYSAYHPEDKKIAEIANDELEHARELKLAMSMIV
jgi:rubrerythrin